MSAEGRSRWQQARLDSVEWAQRGGWVFSGLTGIAPMVVGGLVGVASSNVASGVASAVLSLVLLYSLSLLVFAWRAPEQRLVSIRSELSALREQQSTVVERAPQLTLGIPHIFRHPHRISLGDSRWDEFTGRIVRVPVINAVGSDTAKSVQALLTFKPDDPQGEWSPRDPVLAEWDVDPVVTTIDVPGNGQPQLFNVAFVLDEEHVCVHQWTRHSREAKLHGYGIAGRANIKVEVRGTGPAETAPLVEDTLHIEALEGSLCAQWESEGLRTRRNCVPWRDPPSFMPPPGTGGS